MAKLFDKEEALVHAYIDSLGKYGLRDWTPYHETGGWDLLLVHHTGYQVGIQAKLSLNAKVLAQSLPHGHASDGPDYRAVLVPRDGLQAHLNNIARHIGITVIDVWTTEGWNRSTTYHSSPQLPDEAWYFQQGWVNWCPTNRIVLPDYIPDVTGGKASPVALTLWKIKAIKLMILLERNGAVSRADMKRLEISPSRWTDPYHGFLIATPQGYVRCGRTPDLKAQHPVNWAQIEADFDGWAGVVTGGLI